MASYKQVFFNVHNANASENSAEVKLAKAAFELSGFGDIIIATFIAGGKNADDKEITATVPADYDANVLQQIVERAIKAEKYDAATVSLKNDVRFYEFDPVELKNIQDGIYVKDRKALRSKLGKLTAPGEVPITANQTDVAQALENLFTRKIKLTASTGDSTVREGISITQDVYNRIKNASGDQIAAEYNRLQTALSQLTKETSSGAAVVTMISNGIVTVGQKMWDLYLKNKDIASLATLVSTIIGYVGGIAGAAAIVAAVAAVFFLGWILLKDAINILLVVNGQASDITVNDDYVLNGERKYITEKIPGCLAPSDAITVAYSVGVYLYSKKPVSLFGSCFGIKLKEADTQQQQNGSAISIGMDCPNTLIGGANSICLFDGTAKEAANKAGGGSSADAMTVGNLACEVKRASWKGEINHGIGIIEAA